MSGILQFEVELREYEAMWDFRDDSDVIKVKKMLKKVKVSIQELSKMPGAEGINVLTGWKLRLENLLTIAGEEIVDEGA